VQVCKATDQKEKVPGRTVQNGSAKVIVLGGGGLPAWARKKNEKYVTTRRAYSRHGLRLETEKVINFTF
jgi:hypothetical protein